jgi:hypothetical protein
LWRPFYPEATSSAGSSSGYAQPQGPPSKKPEPVKTGFIPEKIKGSNANNSFYGAVAMLASAAFATMANAADHQDSPST